MYPALTIAVRRGASKPAWVNVAMGRGASKPETVRPRDLRRALTWIILGRRGLDVGEVEGRD